MRIDKKIDQYGKELPDAEKRRKLLIGLLKHGVLLLRECRFLTCSCGAQINIRAGNIHEWFEDG